MTEQPRGLLWISRTQLAAVALVALVSLVGGLAMQLEMWSPAPLFAIERYGDLLGVHGLAAIAVGAPALAGGFGYVAISRLVGAQRVPVIALGWIAFAVWVIGLLATVYALRSEETGWTLYAPSRLHPEVEWRRVVGPGALAIAGLLYAAHIAMIAMSVPVKVRDDKLASAVMFVLAIAAASGLLLVDVIRILTAGNRVVGFDLAGYAFTATVVAALVLATAALDGRNRVLVLLAILCAGTWLLAPVFVFGLGVLGLWIAIAISGGFGRVAVAFVVLGCGPAIVMHGFSHAIAVNERDMLLHDTYFTVGSHHLLGAVILFGMLAQLQHVLARAPRPFVAWIGVGLASGGILLHAFASLRVGAMGMPRRYWSYTPQFTDYHQLGGIAAAIIVAGLLVLVVAWLVGKKV